MRSCSLKLLVTIFSLHTGDLPEIFAVAEDGRAKCLQRERMRQIASYLARLFWLILFEQLDPDLMIARAGS